MLYVNYISMKTRKETEKRDYLHFFGNKLHLVSSPIDFNVVDPETKCLTLQQKVNKLMD